MNAINNNQTKPICFVASARDYHAIDWYRTVKNLCPNRRIFIATDLIESEGVKRLVSDSDEIFNLINLDSFLFTKQSIFGNWWRNIIKVIATPFAAYRLNKLSKEIDAIFHAHSMYYIFLCSLAKIKFIATPMGSDVLVRPNESLIYRFFTIYSLRASSNITVDSVVLRDKVKELSGANAHIIQNGVDTVSTLPFRVKTQNRSRNISIRGIDPNYRIIELVSARNSSDSHIPFEFIYPFYEENYLNSVLSKLNENDRNHGRVSKSVMYEILGEASAVFSIPKSDSSPRSVYESIFCGACVIVSWGKWIEYLPECMRNRVIVVDITKNQWFGDAVKLAHEISSTFFVPSQEAINLFDETQAMKIVCEEFYGQVFNA